jgi:peptide/nickel transport system substrate-binding protein
LAGPAKNWPILQGHTPPTTLTSLAMPSLLRSSLWLAPLIAVGVGLHLWLARESTEPAPSPRSRNAGIAASVDPPRGGHLVATVRGEPRSLNRLVAPDIVTRTISLLTQASLVRINQVTQAVEPWLAERWETADGLHYVLHLRPDLTFSDGAPFTSADVVFTFEALYDARVGSPLAEAFKVDGKPIQVTAPDARTVSFTFPAPYGPGLRILDSLPILPRHVLQSAVATGRFREAWGVAAAPQTIVGLGPFVLRAYVPGQRFELERNPRYWRRDARGERLPYLDRLTLEITPNQSAEMLKFEAGQADVLGSELRPEDIPAVRRLVDAGRARLDDLGVSPDVDYLWFNLTPKGPTTTAVGGVPARPWLGRRELRHAIAHAVNRQQFVDTVMLGAGTPVQGYITPANRQWLAADLPTRPHDLARSRALLDDIGLRDRNGDGLREAEDGTPARFTLFTQKGHATRERAVAVLKEDLRAVGLQVDVSPLERPALLERIMSGAYDAVYFGTNASDLDPAVGADFWLSRGAFHVWNPNQPTPATDWEREIDALMLKQMATIDQAGRKRLFDQVQRIFETELPTLSFAAPNIVIATSARVVNAQPALLKPQILWAADTLAVRP